MRLAVADGDRPAGGESQAEAAVPAVDDGIDFDAFDAVAGEGIVELTAREEAGEEEAPGLRSVAVDPPDRDDPPVAREDDVLDGRALVEGEVGIPECGVEFAAASKAGDRSGVDARLLEAVAQADVDGAVDRVSRDESSGAIPYWAA